MTPCELRFVLPFLILLLEDLTFTSSFIYSFQSLFGKKNLFEESCKLQRRGIYVIPPNESQSDGCRQDNDETEGNIEATGKSSLNRRSFLWKPPLVVLGISSQESLLRLLEPKETAKAAIIENEKDSDGRLTDAIVQSLVFEKVLGSGSYKTVYLVSATIPIIPDNENNTKIFRYAMAVERLRNKRDVKNAYRGVELPGLIQQGLSATSGERELFETIVDWWVQSSNVLDFEQGGRVFSAAAATRSRKEPTKNFAGSRWMVSLKPVYETDFKRFIRTSPMLFPVGEDANEPSHYWTEPVLLAFLLEILHAGKLLHEAGIVHRDIKPKNMMIYSTDGSVKRPVIIDYGFSEFGSPLVLEESKLGKKTDICVVRLGQLKGEVDYVLPEDLANYRGCQRGDAYAMGKTLYEFVFGSAELQEQNKDEDEVISVEGAEMRNQKFRDMLYKDTGTESRFRLSRNTADCLLRIFRGLCGNPKDATNALSFAEAEEILSAFLSQSSLAS